MPAPARISDEQAVKAFIDSDGNLAQAAATLSVHANAVRKRIEQVLPAGVGMRSEGGLGFLKGWCANRGLLGFDPILPGYELKRSTRKLDKDGAYAGEFITQGKAVGPVFELPPDHEIDRLSVNVNGQRQTTQTWIKTKRVAKHVDVADVMKAAFEAYRGIVPLIPPPTSVLPDQMNVYVITDVHHGLMAWGEETGENYDIRIGSDRLRSTMSDLVAQAPASEEALIVNLGDYFHNDSQDNETHASKHKLDVDGRFFKVAITGVTLHQDLIELALQKHARVRVRVLAGNHDPHSSVTLVVGLASAYASNPRVTIELDPADAFFTRYGATLIGACHGHKMKPEKMAMTMAMSRPEDWGASRFRWFLYGHIHHETVKEVGNVRCESFQTIAAKDAYAVSHGYFAGQSLQAVTLHKERGEIGRTKVNIIHDDRRAA